jgi:uncharacterized protein YrrD
MRRANEVIGLPVLTATDSRQIGTIKNIAYSPSRDRVVGFLVDGPDRDALPFSAIREIRADTIVVSSEDVLRETDDVHEIRNALDSDIELDDLNVLDRDGDEIGTIEDTFIDLETGRVLGFQIHSSGEGFPGAGDKDEDRKFFLRFDRITSWDDDGVRVSYSKRDDDLYRERYPEGYEGYRRRRAA